MTRIVHVKTFPLRIAGMYCIVDYLPEHQVYHGTVTYYNRTEFKFCARTKEQLIKEVTETCEKNF
jgi:hypothetical protein